MLDETSGLGERRATTLITAILFIEALWVFLFKYLPLDAGLWTLQAEVVRLHLTGHAADGWRIIPYPVSGSLGPLVAGLLTFFCSGEVAVRLLLTFIAIFVRGMGMLSLFRTLRVRDESIYFLVPVLVITGLWYSGSVPQLLGETIGIWVLVLFVSQNHPRSGAYWLIAAGLFLTSWASGLVFLMCGAVVLMIAVEQRRSIHLSQGWLGDPRVVVGVLMPGAVVMALGLLAGEPIFRLSSSKFLPTGISRLLFLITPAPNVLEATFKYGDILHGLLEALFALVLIGCFGRAFLLAIEETTWQSRSLKVAGYFLLALAIMGPLLGPLGVDSSSFVMFAIILILAGAYSGGPAVRRTPPDRLIHTGALITLIASLAINGFSIWAGSSAASDVLTASRNLVRQERETARQDQRIDSIRVRFALDSTETARGTSALIAIFSYSATAPLYLFTEEDLQRQPWMYQPRGGALRVRPALAVLPIAIMNTNSPAVAMTLGSADRYADSTLRLLTVLPAGRHESNAFGPFVLSLQESGGITIDKGEARYRLAIGTLHAGPTIQLAEK